VQPSRCKIFEGRAYFDTDRCLMVAILRDRFLVSKKAAQKLDVERYFFNKLGDGIY